VGRNGEAGDCLLPRAVPGIISPPRNGIPALEIAQLGSGIDAMVLNIGLPEAEAVQALRATAALRGVQLELIRGDRVLHEALAVGADSLHLAAVFNLSSATAIAYAEIARSLLERPIESTPAPAEASPSDN